jgi:lysozyme
MPITNLKDQLRRDENSRASVYPDSLGFWTIGIGICVDSRKNCGLFPEEIDFIFENRVKKNEAALSAEFPWTDALDEVRRGALLNMVFEMGLRGLGDFHQFLAALEAKNYSAAAVAMLDSLWARSQSPARAQRLSQQILTGVWQ